MKKFIFQDSSFVVATMDKNDELHKEAVFVFQELWKDRKDVKILIPPLGIYEIIVTLKRKGMDHDTITEKIMKLMHIKEVIISSVSEVSAFKHSKLLLKNNNQEESLRTNDFMITSLGIDYDAQILTFDKKMWEKTKKVYPDIYYCKEEEEIKRFISDFNR